MPYDDGSALVFQLIWLQFVYISGNYAHSAPVKVAKILSAFVCMTLSTPPSEMTGSTLAVCVAATACALILHLGAGLRHRWNDEHCSARVARLVLAAKYTYHLASELIQIMQGTGYLSTGRYSIVKDGLVASMGVIAMGAFQDQVSLKHSLQQLLVLNGKEMADQAEVMEMISVALEASDNAIAITDAQHNIIWCNLALRKLIGLVSIDKTANDSLIDAMKVTGEALQQFHSCFGTCQQIMDLHLDEKDVRITVGSFTFSRNGCRNIRYLVSMADTTQVRAMERAEKAAEQAARQRTAMQESMEALTHELRTPLQGIIGTTSLVFDRTNVSPDEMYQCFNTVMASSRLLLTLINNLLDSHKMDANMMDDFQLISVPLAGVMRETADFVRPIAALNDIDPQLCLDFDEANGIAVRSNAVRFQQILLNLVSNAIKYAGKGSIILRAEVVSVRAANERIARALAQGCNHQDLSSPSSSVVIISVEDSGDGILLEMRDKIFLKFSMYAGSSRSDCPSAFASGTGIGLNLCCKFVDKMGGSIWATNKASGGACFSFCLPVESASVLVPVLPSNGKVHAGPVQGVPFGYREPGGNTMPTKALRVLVVDDSLINLKVLERMVRRLSDKHLVTTALSGAIALSELDRLVFDLVITDIQMPGMDGMDLCEAIRKTSTILRKPIVVALTAETSECLHQRCSAVGMAHVLYKPISFPQFQQFFESIVLTLKPCCGGPSSTDLCIGRSDGYASRGTM